MPTVSVVKQRATGLRFGSYGYEVEGGGGRGGGLVRALRKAGCSPGERGLSPVSMVFPAVGGKLKPAAELSRTAFNEARVAEAKVGGQEYADRLQRPTGEKE